jgi:malate dehydrogenase (oxaloacetate-decarboxylating)(NADP+)
MKLACVRALADLAMAEPSELVTKAYGGKPMRFGPEYLIPKPFDPRLISKVAPAVARAAMDSGVATRPIEDLEAYRQRLTQFVFRSGLIMKPVFERARQAPKRLVYAEGEESRVLQAAQQVVDERIASPIFVGRAEIIERRIQQFGLRMQPGVDCEIINILQDERYDRFWTEYHEFLGRKGISPKEAQTVVRTNSTAVAALVLRVGEADAMLCGTVGPFLPHLTQVLDVIGKTPGVHDVSTLTALILPSGPLFICDTHVSHEPDAEEFAEMTMLAAAEVRAFGLTPKVALVSRSNFGTYDTRSATQMRKALALLRERAPDLEVEGEMHADTALSEELRTAVFPGSRLKGRANLLIMPNYHAAHIAYSLLKILGGGVSLGPILVGANQTGHVVTESISVRGLVNMSAVCVVQAQVQAERTGNS